MLAPQDTSAKTLEIKRTNPRWINTAGVSFSNVSSMD
jgi:hypothetical protein